MKKFKTNCSKKVCKGLSLVLVGILVVSFLTACGGQGSNSDKDMHVIGISQFAEHGSLDNCREGFIEGLEAEGLKEDTDFKVDYKNAMADMGTASQIAATFVSDKVDLICAIATPSAQAAYNEAMDAEIPVIFSAVTDPISAQLAGEDGKPVGEVTGTSDTLPVEEQLKMIRGIMPEAKTIGIMYTTSEVNSVSTILEYEQIAGEYGFEIVKSGISTTADVPLAIEDLLSKVDCITNLTDNTVVNSLPTILEKANEKQIPVFGSEIEQVRIGCLAAEGIDYMDLGRQTGRMAALVLKAEMKASEIPFEIISNPGFYANTEVAKALGIEIPQSMIEEAVEVFDTIETN